jgi:hypothetical protein
MMQVFRNIQSFLIKLEIKWWSIVLTTILCFLDSLSNVLLLLGIGQIVANQISSTSTKGNILKLFFGELISTQKFTFVFIFFLLIKILSVALKKIKIEQVKTAISTNMIRLWSRNDSPSNEIKSSEIANFFAKGVIGFISDSFFLLVVFAVLANYNLAIGSLFIAFIATNIFVIKILYHLNKNIFDENQKNKKRLIRKQKLIKQHFIELRKIDRFEKEKGILTKRIGSFQLANFKLNLIIGIAEAITPLSFFSFLLILAHSSQLFSKTPSSTFLEITLLLIYSQGSLRRNMRATRYWVQGNNEISRFLKDLDQQIIETQKKLTFNHPFEISTSTNNLSASEKDFLHEVIQNESNYYTQFRYIDQRNRPLGESLLEAACYRSKIKEKEKILKLASKIDPSGDLTKILSDESFDLNTKITIEQLFFFTIIQSEMDQSELILFENNFLPIFIKFFDKKPDYLKKIYLCES